MLTKAEIKRIRSLGDKAGRLAEGVFAVEGEKMVGELLQSGFTVREVYRTGENISPAEMARISFLRTPTPVLAVAEIPTSHPAEMLPERLALALDDVQDPGNVGTIIRLADWFGIHDLYCSPATADCWSPKVVQATMGAIFRVRVHYVPLDKWLPQGPALFPEDMITDQPERQIVSEIVREKLLRTLDKEVPHGTAVEVTRFSQREDGLLDIGVTIFCEKASHKGIIIGKGGAMLKKVSSQAREDMERFLGAKVYLETWVKVKENWRDNPAAIQNFGYTEE